MSFPKEAEVVINGHRLSQAEAMTLRVAVGSFMISLMEEGLGDDETGVAICEGYKAACHDIMQKMEKK